MIDKDLLRDKVVLAALTHVPFDGWSNDALVRGAADVDMSPADIDILFPGGSRSAVRHWLLLADRLMLEDVVGTDLGSLRIRDKITLLVRTRLERWTPHREAVRRALALSVLPGYAEDGLQSGFTTVDAMWRVAGDKATDYNFYTKRGLLAAVYTSTLLVWLDDKSEGCCESWAFLERRIADVMKVPKYQARIKDVLSRLPNPIDVLKRKRRII